MQERSVPQKGHFALPKSGVGFAGLSEDVVNDGRSMDRGPKGRILAESFSFRQLVLAVTVDIFEAWVEVLLTLC
jgi:hypothetical protein